MATAAEQQSQTWRDNEQHGSWMQLLTVPYRQVSPGGEQQDGCHLEKQEL